MVDDATLRASWSHREGLDRTLTDLTHQGILDRGRLIGLAALRAPVW